MSEGHTLWIVQNYRIFEQYTVTTPEVRESAEVLCIAEAIEGLSWSAVISALPLGSEVVFQSLTLIGDNARDIARLTERFLNAGARVRFAKEQVTIADKASDAFKLLQAMPDPLAVRMARHQQGMERAKREGKSN